MIVWDSYACRNRRCERWMVERFAPGACSGCGWVRRLARIVTVRP